MANPLPVASWRHTVRLAAVFLVLAAAGVLLQGPAGASADPAPHRSLLPLYASLVASEWLLFRFVAVGLRASGSSWRDLVGRWPSQWRGRTVDALCGVLLSFAWVAAALAQRAATPDQGAGVRSLLPHGTLETALWIVLSLSAGFCEEITFRGYFQRQLEAFTHNRGLALVLQASLFGVAHAYQGVPSALAIAGYGVLLGGLTLWRGNLRPAIVAHALTDLLLGLGAR